MLPEQSQDRSGVPISLFLPEPALGFSQGVPMSDTLDGLSQGRDECTQEVSSRPVSWQLDQIVSELRVARTEWRTSTGRSRDLGSRELPSRQALECIFSELRGALFPMRLGPTDLRLESEDFY